MTTSELNNQSEISSSGPEILSLLKIVEYLSLAAVVCAFILSRVFPDNQLIVVWGAVFLSLFIFFFLTNKKVFQDSKKAANRLSLGKNAELYTCLLDPNSASENKPINRAREKAIGYCQQLIDDYTNNRETSRNIYYTFQMATVILSGVTPILVLVDKLEAGQAWLKWLPVICPAIASIVASIVTSFPFQENWISANTAVELLEAEQEKFILGVTPAYRCYDVADESERQKQAKMAIENFINQVNSIHLKQVQGSSEPQTKEEKTEQTQSTESNQG